LKRDSWPDKINEKWNVPMNLGNAARNTIKGHSLNYDLAILKDTRDKTLAEFRRRDDEWLPPSTRTGTGTSTPYGFTSPNTNPITTGNSSF
jgi:hypothetical protein